eukprot:7853510-Alexandrium_andersonii.AAC.2
MARASRRGRAAARGTMMRLRVVGCSAMVSSGARWRAHFCGRWGPGCRCTGAQASGSWGQTSMPH